ncbi:MAG: PhzF family phenazine biosynthesis protein [Bacteroidales bacterium]|nr:PhzF family phenazine biosynthesis protein [Bacteroidales bacterium]
MPEKIKIYQIDAFTNKVYSGNPASVLIMKEWLDEELMQKIADENNLAETAFVVKRDMDFEIRWFTPAVEVDLCGHATLAAAYVLFKYYSYEEDKITFYSRYSGELIVEKDGDKLTLDFPTDTISEVKTPQKLVNAFGKTPNMTFKGKTDYLMVFSSQKQIENLHPDFEELATIGGRGVIVTAPGEETDFVSRFFAPQVGINEDPVTGSAHTTLIPYWSKTLNKKKLSARQLSKRQGDLICEDCGDRVKITGNAVTYMIGEILI